MQDMSTEARIRETFNAQRAHRWQLAQTDAATRLAKLERLRKTIVAKVDLLNAALAADFRKNPAEIEVTETYPVFKEIELAKRHLAEWMLPQPVGTPLLLGAAKSEIRFEPKGQVLILAPWNYPFGLLFSPLVSAVAAGNCVIVKPSEKTPRTADVIAEIIAEVFERKEVETFLGGHEVAQALLAQPFDHIFFTGSPAIGKKVMEAAAKHLASVTLELGGKSPVVVTEDANVERAGERVAWGKFINAGQTCVAPDYVLVQAGREREMVQALVKALDRYYGPAERRKENPDFPRIVDARAFERLSRLIDEAVAGGAKIEVGGERDPEQRYIAPTVLSGVTPEMALMKEEIFGPILPVLGFTALDEALGRIQAADKPLAMYVFATKRKVIEHILSRTTAGGTVVNDIGLHWGNPELPFGGVGTSGLGSYHGHFGFMAFSHSRALVTQRVTSSMTLLYPPLQTPRRRLASRIMSWFG